ncbi:sugar phosphate nucleotidyltransferase [Prolixibacter sp. SD074]|jgi:choline kinase|uniref:nucleotidyltransferase family protein n=1 Tax=Prolixibacter sp. SD074 TaxID=2652391 RepID=UPI001278E467|nr:sugar phosphate nucleotidyltransferase [Prolixibacter sp. SD074]GET29599.1 nucleotidyltransferase [Prolixibacter sp. SD074]
MMKPTLVILAAGMGSRYGGLKQLDEVGPNGEAIIDYSLYDAIRAGFGKVVFVIREDFADEFKARFAPQLDGKIEVAYVYQALDKIPSGYDIHPERVKPWGTGHALLMAEPEVEAPMAVINADDFYGPQAYQEIASFLTSSTDENEYGMVGYQLDNTLSEFGSVSRGVCQTDSAGRLTEINERTKIQKEGNEIAYYEDEKRFTLTGKEPVSMNFWGVKTSVFHYLKEGFREFLQKKGNKLKSEFFVPFLINDKIVDGTVSVKVLTCDSPWFGVTYREDKPYVQDKLKKLIADKVYPENLWK